MWVVLLLYKFLFGEKGKFYMEKKEITALRRAKKITQKEVAKHLRCSVSMVCRFERDERNFSKKLEEEYYKYIKNKT